LIEIKTLDTLSLASVTLNLGAIEIPEVIFRTPTLIDWPQMIEHHALQDICNTMTKQQKAFEQMGFTLSGDPEIAARESIEALFVKDSLGSYPVDT